MNDLRLHINVLKIRRLLQYKSNSVQISIELQSLIQYYHDSAILSNCIYDLYVLEVKDDRERQFGDDYLLLAAHLLLEEFFDQRIDIFLII